MGQDTIFFFKLNNTLETQKTFPANACGCKNEYHSVVTSYYTIVLYFVTPRKATLLNISEYGILHLCLSLSEEFL